jgi:hypothetical protein
MLAASSAGFGDPAATAVPLVGAAYPQALDAVAVLFPSSSLPERHVVKLLMDSVADQLSWSRRQIAVSTGALQCLHQVRGWLKDDREAFIRFGSIGGSGGPLHAPQQQLQGQQ